MQLFSKFFESERYKDVRTAMDHGRVDASWINVERQEEQLVDYLNFFEFMAALNDRNEIKHREVNMLFAYYLELIDRTPDVRAYVAKNGFESLDKFLNRGRS